MINHIWSVLCQRSVIDSKSNNISLIDIFEKLEVNLSVPVSEGKNKVKKINVPVNYEIVSLWTYDKEDQGKNIYLQIKFILPGGKAELNESINDCLMREVFEETGCRIKVIKEIGMVIEYRSKVAIKQTSYCFLAEAVSCSTPKFVKEEIEEECELEWVTLDEAISMLSKERSKGYKGKFILKRELVFLEEVKKME